MKTTLLALFAFMTMQGQETEHFNWSISLEPYSTYKEKSPNLTFEVELEEEYFYVKAGTQILLGLEPSYVDVAGGIGLNISSGLFRQLRYYGGIRLGLISRGGNTYPLFGQELGLNYNMNNDWFIGLRATNDYRSDFDYWGTDSKYVFNGSVRVGKRF